MKAEKPESMKGFSFFFKLYLYILNSLAGRCLSDRHERVVVVFFLLFNSVDKPLEDGRGLGGIEGRAAPKGGLTRCLTGASSAVVMTWTRARGRLVAVFPLNIFYIRDFYFLL